jgi:hypothetical protein
MISLFMQSIKKILSTALPTILMVAPLANVFAQQPIQYPTGVAQTGYISLQTVLQFVQSAMNFLVTGGVLIGIGFIVYGGIRYIVSHGDAAKAKTARGIVLNGLIGIGIILGVGILVNTVAAIVSGQFFGGYTSPIGN